MNQRSLLGASLILLSLLGSTTQALTVTDLHQGPFSLPSNGTGAGELSGLIWTGGNQYYTISDKNARLYPLIINLDPKTGIIMGAALGPARQLSVGKDLEGLAYDAAKNSIYVSDETGPAVREHNLVSGSLRQTIPVPPVFDAVRDNLSLESLSLQQGGASLWTANEEALHGDGPIAMESGGIGTTVRLQKLDANFRPAGQWAYNTDGIGNSPWSLLLRSGVSELLVLPTGELVVLERALGAINLTQFGFRSRLYQVDFTGATDVSSITTLEGQTYVPVSKTLLWERTFSDNNFEGLALGPLLDNSDDYSLLLISDDGSGLQQSLYALRLTSVPIPASLPLLVSAFACIGLLAWRRRTHLSFIS